METPAFKHRFGILLESYLRGCGTKMFVSKSVLIVFPTAIHYYTNVIAE